MSIEIRSKRDKFSPDSDREALFELVEYVGEFNEDILVNMFSKVLSDASLRDLMEKIRKRKVIRVYLSGESLLKMMKSLNVKLDEDALKNYEYIIVLEPVAAA